MKEIETLVIHPSFLGKEIFVSREVRDVPANARFGQTTPGYREYAASSGLHPAFVIRVEKIKHAPKPTKRQKIELVHPVITYVTERNANRRAVDVPIIVAQEIKLVD
ncbi:hypothetical protein VNN36_07755 [Lactococcus garvieae]|uniref:hypothetical protein n=1 Tax=Lactococcus garvieae TaxID=1363 RepID=UPI0030CDFBF5